MIETAIPSTTTERIAVQAERLLNDAVLGFFALVSLFLLISPGVFDFSPRVAGIIVFIEFAIVALFAIEYGAALLLADNKIRFVTNVWRIIDALIIVAALVALLPLASDILRNSPALRLARLARVALLGTRSGFALQDTPQRSIERPRDRSESLEVAVLGDNGARFERVSFENGLARIRASDPDWLFISGVTEDRLALIADALTVPEKAVASLFQSSVPRFDRLERFTTMFARYPVREPGTDRFRRVPLLLVGAGENVVVLSREQTELIANIERRLPELDTKMPRMVRATAALVGEIVQANTGLVEQLEAELIKLEARQAGLKDEPFLRLTFELRAEILRVRSSLKHLKGALREIAGGSLVLTAADFSDRDLFRLLADDTSDLYEAIEDCRESLQALVDLRLNVSSFQMNRVMRLLALLTSLALIPATAGGLLGMNLTDTPWPGTLAQVSFGVAAGMAFSLYLFAIKGWFR